MKNNELDKNANASNQTLLIAFNTSDKTAKANLELNGANYRLVAGKGNLMTKLKDKESLELPPLSFVIFEKI